MAKLALGPGMKLDLAATQILIVEHNLSEQDILAHIMVGFGGRAIVRCGSGAEAIRILGTETFDLVLIGKLLPDMGGVELIRWIRRKASEAIRTVPVLLVSGHTRATEVAEARDCGASYVVIKPLSPQILLNRIVWLTREQRQFVVCDSYAGPDRRFKRLGPPPGIEGRRDGDLSTDIGEAKDPNMSQNAIDAMFSPAKVPA
jgi:DNA-binding response OmpR family regulator